MAWYANMKAEFDNFAQLNLQTQTRVRG
jgi:hypothetical protein